MLDVGFGDGFVRFTLSSRRSAPRPLTARFDPNQTPAVPVIANGNREISIAKSEDVRLTQ